MLHLLDHTPINDTHFLTFFGGRKNELEFKIYKGLFLLQY